MRGQRLACYEEPPRGGHHIRDRYFSPPHDLGSASRLAEGFQADHLTAGTNVLPPFVASTDFDSYPCTQPEREYRVPVRQGCTGESFTGRPRNDSCRDARRLELLGGVVCERHLAARGDRGKVVAITALPGDIAARRDAGIRRPSSFENRRIRLRMRPLPRRPHSLDLNPDELTNMTTSFQFVTI